MENAGVRFGAALVPLLPEDHAEEEMTPNRWLSRKFLLSLSAQVTALIVLLWPEHESVVLEASRSITALLVMLLSSLGYVHAEASLDRERAAGPTLNQSAETPIL